VRPDWWRRSASLAILVVTLSGCALLRDREEVDPFDDVDTPTGPAIRYEVLFEGEMDPELRSTLEGASQSRAEAERPPASEFLLQRRAERDLPNLTAALRSLGYYEGTVEFELRQPPSDEPPAPAAEDGEEAASRQPRTDLVFTIDPGPRYRFDVVELTLLDPEHGFGMPGAASLGLETGKPAVAQAVLDAQGQLARQARQAGHPFAESGELTAVIDQDVRTMDVTLSLATGPRADLAAPRFTGGEGISSKLLRRRVPFRPGDRYDPQDVADGRQSLIDTGLFTTVIVDQAESLDEEGRLPVTYELSQRKHRSIGAGLGYRTDEGPYGNLFWEHRNLLGAGERLRTDLYASPIRQEVAARLRKPDIGMRGLNLLTDAALRFEDTDAYESKSLSGGVGLERIFRPGLAGSLGVAYRYAQIEESGEEEDTFGLLSLPGRFDWDFSDDLLDPTRGGRLSLLAAPYLDTLGPDTKFFKSQVTHTRYISLAEDPRFVLALRGSVGSTVGADRDEIPADERFYSGGGGSVRGFGFQLAGPVDDNDDPIGGRSLLEFNTELRYRVTESIGLVSFVDAGTVYESTLPDFSEELLVGAGLGMRYVTPIGPLRFDVGVPVNRRRRVDDLYQVYISIGQAF
jgi:translocation and assembly module TamA